MVFFVMLGISVCIAVLAQLPLLEFIREVSGRSNRFGIAFDTDCGVDIFLGNVGIACAGGKHMIGQVRCPCRERKSQRKGGQQQKESGTVELHFQRNPMSDLSTFGQYNKLADLLIEKVSKEDLAECARLLAMNVAHYQSKYGELPLDEKLALIGMTKPNVEQIQLMTDGIEILVGVLSNVVVGIEQARH